MSKSLERDYQFEVEFFEGDVSYEQEWGYLYINNCEICKRKKMNVNYCKHQTRCKFFVINTDEGVIRVKRMNTNANCQLEVQQVRRAMIWL